MFEYMSITFCLNSTFANGLNVCRITFYSNSQHRSNFQNTFEYMSYYLLLKLEKMKKI